MRSAASKLFFLSSIAALVAIAAPTAAQTAADTPAQSSAVDYTPPTLAGRTPADYPLLSREMHEEGTALVTFVVNDDGTVGDVFVTKSSGFRRLDDASLNWVHQWLYHPATKYGKPIAVTAKTNVAWSLAPDEAAPAFGVPATKIYMTRDDFPSGAWDAKESGICSVVLTVDQRGSVVDYRATKNSGFADLDAATKEFLTRRWHMAPVTINGQPARTMLPVDVVWSHDPAPPK
jgi:TonB family protein